MTARASAYHDWMSQVVRIAASLSFSLLFSTGCTRHSADISGRWNAILRAGNAPVPFRLDLAQQDGSSATGSFFDGDRAIPSSSGTLQGENLHLHFDTYNADLNAIVHDGRLTGEYIVIRPGKKTARKVTAERFSQPPPPTTAPPLIAGDWELRSSKGDASIAWKMVVQQNGSALRGAILRLDGDTGALTGTFENGKLLLSHFSGARPTLLEGTLRPDGKLQLLLDRADPILGVRSSDPAVKSLTAEPDPFHTTSVKDPLQPFQFSGTDANGQMVSSTDSRFQHKALIVSVGGTWCPNCMDEAPFLVDLYRKFHAQGLEIVGLNFESGDTSYDRGRVKSFEQRYGIPYPVVIAGTTGQVTQKLDQIANFSAFPTTIFVGRDGRVKGIHDGFASVATGPAHRQLQEETEQIIRRLLAG